MKQAKARRAQCGLLLLEHGFITFLTFEGCFNAAVKYFLLYFFLKVRGLCWLHLLKNKLNFTLLPICFITAIQVVIYFNIASKCVSRIKNK